MNGPPLARARLVDRLGEQRLARARLALDQDRRLDAGDPRPGARTPAASPPRGRTRGRTDRSPRAAPRPRPRRPRSAASWRPPGTSRPAGATPTRAGASRGRSRWSSPRRAVRARRDRQDEVVPRDRRIRQHQVVALRRPARQLARGVLGDRALVGPVQDAQPQPAVTVRVQAHRHDVSRHVAYLTARARAHAGGCDWTRADAIGRDRARSARWARRDQCTLIGPPIGVGSATRGAVQVVRAGVGQELREDPTGGCGRNTLVQRRSSGCRSRPRGRSSALGGQRSGLPRRSRPPSRRAVAQLVAPPRRTAWSRARRCCRPTAGCPASRARLVIALRKPVGFPAARLASRTGSPGPARCSGPALYRSSNADMLIAFAIRRRQRRDLVR